MTKELNNLITPQLNRYYFSFFRNNLWRLEHFKLS
jgi:hypothetical protein